MRGGDEGCCRRRGSRRPARASLAAARAPSPRPCRARSGGRRRRGCVWPMRCARSIACASTAGFHQGSSRKTYSAAVRFRPSAAGLEADQEQPAVRVGLEALDPRLRGRASGRRGTRRRCLAASSAARTIASKLVNCEKTSALCPSSSDLVRAAASSTSSFALGSAARVVVDQARVAGRLAQAQQRLEDLDLRLRRAPRARSRAEQRCAVVVAQLVVELALLRLQLAVDRLLGLRAAAPARPAPWCGAG